MFLSCAFFSFSLSSLTSAYLSAVVDTGGDRGRVDTLRVVGERVGGSIAGLTDLTFVASLGRSTGSSRRVAS